MITVKFIFYVIFLVIQYSAAIEKNNILVSETEGLLLQIPKFVTGYDPELVPATSDPHILFSKISINVIFLSPSWSSKRSFLKRFPLQRYTGCHAIQS
jgi:hypothetical protein